MQRDALKTLPNQQPTSRTTTPTECAAGLASSSGVAGREQQWGQSKMLAGKKKERDALKTLPTSRSATPTERAAGLASSSGVAGLASSSGVADREQQWGQSKIAGQKKRARPVEDVANQQDCHAD